MNLLKYQTEMSKFLNVYNTTLGCPHTILLCGPDGHGQDEFVCELGNNFHIQVVDITDSLNNDTIQQISLATEPFIYYINLNDVSIKEQSSLLITLENPTSGSFFVLNGTSDSVLDAIRNRCQILNVTHLMLEDLRRLFPGASDELLTSNLSPKDIEKYIGVDLIPYNELIDKMLLIFNRANISNILTIASKFKWDKETDGLEADLFCALLLNRIVSLIRKGNKVSYNLFYSVKKMTSDISAQHANKKRIFENFLISAKGESFKWC